METAQSYGVRGIAGEYVPTGCHLAIRSSDGKVYRRSAGAVDETPFGVAAEPIEVGQVIRADDRGAVRPINLRSPL